MFSNFTPVHAATCRFSAKATEMTCSGHHTDTFPWICRDSERRRHGPRKFGPLLEDHHIEATMLLCGPSNQTLSGKQT